GLRERRLCGGLFRPRAPYLLPDALQKGMNMETRLIYKTKSVCPVCLREIYADIAARPDGIYMDKRCPEHGEFSTLVWADTAEGYLRWFSAGGIDTAALPQTEEEVERALAGASFAD